MNHWLVFKNKCLSSALKKKYIKCLKVAFYIYLLQNIGYITHVVQNILQLILYPIACTLAITK